MRASAHRTEAESGTKRKWNSGARHTHTHKHNAPTQGLLSFTLAEYRAGHIEVNASEGLTLGPLWGHVVAFIHAQHIFIPQARIYK